MSSTESSAAPSRTAPPIFLALAASSRPCDDIQMLCHASITTAMPRIDALKSSCPIPSASREMNSAPPATSIDPTTPAAMPAAIQRERPGMPRVAAPMMPTIRAASRTSRKTTRAVPNMSLLGDDHALGGLLIELADELVLARLERPHEHRALRLARNDLLDLEVVALELLGGGVLVVDHDLHLLARGDLDAVGGELVVLDHDVDVPVGGEDAERGSEEGGGDEAKHFPCLSVRGRWCLICTNDNRSYLYPQGARTPPVEPGQRRSLSFCLQRICRRIPMRKTVLVLMA